MPGFHEPQGIAVLADYSLVAVANSQAGDLVLFDAREGTVKRTIPLSEDADNAHATPVVRPALMNVRHGW